MSRRNYKVEQSYIEWLKSLGCVLYLPLTEGDLQDKISGVSLIANQNASITWDSAEGAYKFDLPTSVPSYKGIELPNVVIDFGNNLSNAEYTCVIDIKVDSSVLGQTPILLTSKLNWKLQWYSGTNTRNKWIRLCSLKNKGDNYTFMYEDERLYSQDAQSTGDDNGTLLFARPGWNNRRFTAFAKSAYIFDKALTQEQINQLI